MARRASIDDLTVDQVETLELEFGIPMDRWNELPSRMALYRRIYSLATGAPDAEVRAMRWGDITAAIGEENGESPNP